MSSSRPPQLQISLPTETGTSFKRSFEQYGFDLDTPLNSSGESSGSSGGTTSLGTGNRNDRNKRARSSSSSSNSDLTTSGSSGSFEVEVLVGGGSASSNVSTSHEDDHMAGMSANHPISLSSDGQTLGSSPFSVHRPSLLTNNPAVFSSQRVLQNWTPSNSATVQAVGRALQSPPVPEDSTSNNDTQMLHPSSRSSLSIRSSAFPISSSQPPRIPTPSPLDEDLQMDILDTQSASTSDTSENYRASLARFNMFDSEISAIRHHNPTHSLTSPSSSPPSPLSPGFSEDAPRLAQSVPGLRVFTMGAIRSSEERSNNNNNQQCK